MEYILICQSLFVRINCGDELSVWRIKRSQLYSPFPFTLYSLFQTDFQITLLCQFFL